MDRRGQLILLSGMLIAMSVALITLYLTTASMSGYRVSYSPWDLPYYEMRMGLFESVRAIKLAGQIYPSSPSNVIDLANDFYRNMSKIYARHGYFLVVSVINSSLASNVYNITYIFKTDKVNLTVSNKPVVIYR